MAGRTFIACLMLAVACDRPAPPTAPDAVAVDSTMAPMGAAVVGRFRGVGHQGGGSVRFTAENGVGLLQFSDDFVVGGAPGPFVYVNTTNNANTGHPLRIAALKSSRGAQTYTFQLAAGVNYRWVLVWCDPYNVPLSEAELPPPSDRGPSGH